jgi:ribosome-associated protein
MEPSFDDNSALTQIDAAGNTGDRTNSETDSDSNSYGRQYQADVLACARMLSEHKARDTVALHVSEVCSFTDYMIIATANSVAHARGLQKQLQNVFADRGLQPLNGNKRHDDNTWTLIDLGFVVIHIMTEESRAFYELERLWFTGSEVFRSETEPS